jgi:bifunctional ADP-heptose synthase (sugar kinase/adenylyltransferase)
VPTEAREVYDVSGAGDTVLATLAHCLAAGWPIEDAVRWANRAAGIVVGKFGTASVTRAELGLGDAPEAQAARGPAAAPGEACAFPPTPLSDAPAKQPSS